VSGAETTTRSISNGMLNLLNADQNLVQQNSFRTRVKTIPELLPPLYPSIRINLLTSRFIVQQHRAKMVTFGVQKPILTLYNPAVIFLIIRNAAFCTYEFHMIRLFKEFQWNVSTYSKFLSESHNNNRHFT
jgi:hypothetical protein